MRDSAGSLEIQVVSNCHSLGRIFISWSVPGPFDGRKSSRTGDEDSGISCADGRIYEL